MRKCLFVLLAVSGSAWSFGGPANPPFTPTEIEPLLPKDGATLNIMQFTASPRMIELTKRLKDSAQKDPDWWARHVKKAKPGEPLPYDEKLGLTKEEYAEYRKLDLGISKAGEAKLAVKRKGDKVTFDGGRQLSELAGISIDLQANTVSTPHGVASKLTRIKASDGQKATGPWNGIQWSFEKLDLETDSAFSVNFALGRMAKADRGVIYYVVRGSKNGTPIGVRHFLLFDLPAKNP